MWSTGHAYKICQVLYEVCWGCWHLPNSRSAMAMILVLQMWKQHSSAKVRNCCQFAVNKTKPAWYPIIRYPRSYTRRQGLKWCTQILCWTRFLLYSVASMHNVEANIKNAIQFGRWGYNWSSMTVHAILLNIQRLYPDYSWDALFCVCDELSCRSS